MSIFERYFRITTRIIFVDCMVFPVDLPLMREVLGNG
jgi:hypothetical protein